MGHESSDRDRRVRQADRLARILSVLQLIQSKGRWNAKSIADELGVTERTIYRDLQALEFAGVPWYFDIGSESYRVRSDYQFAVPTLSNDEIIGQVIASSVARASDLFVGDAVQRATQKFAAATNKESQRLIADARAMVSVLNLQVADHSGARDTIVLIQSAILDGKQIEGRYSSPYESEAIDVQLNPFRLCLVKKRMVLSWNSAYRVRT